MVRRLLVVGSQVRTVHSGVGTYAAMILRELSERADAVAVTVATWDREVDRDRYPELSWIGLGAIPKRDPTPGRFWTLGRRLVRAFERAAFDFDLVHFLDARDGHAFFGSVPARGVEVVGTVHDDYAARVGRNPLHYVGSAADPLRRFFFHRWLRRLEARTYPKFDRLLVNSVATGETVRQAYGLDPERVTPVTLTIDADAGPAPQRLAGEPSLVFVGGNFYRKGLDSCVEALTDLTVEFPDIRLHVIGSCRSSARIEALARGRGVADAVVFHGHLPPERAAAMLAGADIFVMPSRTEALGLVYLEAFRAGVPVIAGDRGGVTEIVRHGMSGLLVTPGSPQELVEAVARLTRDPELRQLLARGGRTVLAERTPERLLSETTAAYGLEAPVGGTVPPSPAL
jgi:glycogen(starch) synthase